MNRRGFTLIEMMVALAIFAVGVLAIAEMQMLGARSSYKDKLSDSFYRTVSSLVAIFNNPQACEIAFGDKGSSGFVFTGAVPQAVQPVYILGGTLGALLIPPVAPIGQVDGLYYTSSITQVFSGPQLLPSNNAITQYVVNFEIKATPVPQAFAPVIGNTVFVKDFTVPFWILGGIIVSCSCPPNYTTEYAQCI